MEYNENASLDTDLVRPTSGGGGFGGGMGSGRGGGLAVGGLGGIIILILSLFFGPGLLGSDPGTGTQDQAQTQQQANTQCKTGADIKNNRECRFTAFMTSLNQYWSTAIKSGHQSAVMQPFKGQVNTACGAATSEVGPFYCPGDQTIYLDTDFFDTLQQQFGAQGGDAAEAYVVAHEYGHHISNEIGTMAQAQQDRSTGPTSSSVRLELQADCFGGVWLRHATDDPNSPIKTITEDDLNRAVDAAQAVGDDTIQQRAQGRVDREAWTHGSAAMRKQWLATGYNSGDPSKCDTFAPNAPVG